MFLFYSIFDLQSCQPDNLVDGLLEDVPLGDLDIQNENVRSENRATSLFSIFTQREVIIQLNYLILGALQNTFNSLTLYAWCPRKGHTYLSLQLKAADLFKYV